MNVKSNGSENNVQTEWFERKDCLFSIKSQKRDTFIPTDSFYDLDLNET